MQTVRGRLGAYSPQALGSGTYTISDGHLLLLRNDDGTYAVSIVVHDKNTFTLGDGGTEYKRLND